MQQQDIARIDAAAQQLLEEGDLVGAQKLYMQISELDSLNAGAWFMLGSIDGELGSVGESLACLRKAVDLDADFLEAHYNLGNMLRMQGHLDDALNHFKAVVRIDPATMEAWLMMSAIYGTQNRFADAEACGRRAVELNPDSIDAHMNIANSLIQQGKLTAAAGAYEHITGLDPNASLAWLMLARTYLPLHRREDARAAYEQVVKIEPGCAEAHHGLASMHQYKGEYEEAIKRYQTVVNIEPHNVEAYHGIGVALIQLGRQQAAVEVFRKALQIKPDYAEAMVGLAAALVPLGARDEALICCDRALEIIPGYPDAISLAATIEQQSGLLQNARNRLRPLIEQGNRSVNIALAYAHVSKTLDEPEKPIAVLEDILGDSGQLTVADRRNLHFELGNLYDATTAYDRAFPHYQEGNALRPAGFDGRRHADYVRSIIDIHDGKFMQHGPRAATHSSGRALFIVGMPRSGTSLVEQILASHPAVFAAGELPDIAEIVGSLPETLGSESAYPLCMRALTREQADMLSRRYLDRLSGLDPIALRVTNKMPDNFLYLGLIELLFPDARVIHCERDPLDICLSCYFQDFSLGHPYSYDLQNLADYYQTYAMLMAHWKKVLRISLMDIRYEDLVRDQEATTKKLLAFCGLEWDDRCLRFYETERFVGTASYDQVRRPLYSGSIGRWRNYKKHLGILAEALGR